MAFSVRLTKLVALFVTYSFALLLFPSGRVAAVSGKRSSSISVENPPIETPRHRANEILVRFRSGASQADKDVAETAVGTHLKKKLKGDSAVETLEFTGASDALDVALQLNQNPAVEFAEPNFIVKSDQLAATNDSRIAEQWALKNVGQNGGQYGSDIGAVKGWQTSTGGTQTVIAVMTAASFKSN